MSMGGHQSARMLKDEWLTPPHILDALGPFDLDPCAPAAPPWATATTRFSLPEDGLSRPWHGRVWLNPPYGRETAGWMRKMARHAKGTALIFARTEVAFWHQWVWPYATAFLFLRGRLHFHHLDGARASATAGAPSVLIAYGQNDAQRLARSGLSGCFVEHTRPI